MTRISVRPWKVALGWVLVCMLVQGVSSAVGAPPAKPRIRLEPPQVMLGTIPFNEVTDSTGALQIVVHNDGGSPLILQKVTGCCGTTIKSYTREPILPGKSGSVRVFFRVEPRLQKISRTITIHSNTEGANPVKCQIEGEVVMTKKGGRLAR